MCYTCYSKQIGDHVLDPYTDNADDRLDASFGPVEHQDMRLEETTIMTEIPGRYGRMAQCGMKDQSSRLFPLLP
jgi:hypothetical protein